MSEAEPVSQGQIERVSRAIQRELRRQGVLFQWDEDEDLSRLMMTTGDAADLPALSRAIIEEMRANA